MGFFLIQINYHAEAMETVAPVINLALKYNYTNRLCQIRTIEGSYLFWNEEDVPNSFKTLKKAIRDADEVNNYISLIVACSQLGPAMGLNCVFDDS